MPEAIEFRLVEVKAVSNIQKAKHRQQFLSIEELIYKNELAILLGGRYLNSSSDYDFLIDALQKRLISFGIHALKEELVKYLATVSRIFEARLLNGEDISAIPYTNGAYKKRGAKPKRKKGKKRQLLHNGQIYGSIKEAADNDPQTSYAALKQKLWREDMQNKL